jgi:hypothetical protein
MKFGILILTIAGSFLIYHSASAQEVYKGKPFNNNSQVIPGKLQCEFYDTGGEGIAYHDLDSVNGGSGRLNPANGTYLNEFRMNERVGISYTKSNNCDNNPYNLFNPEIGQLYVGWTKPGEWLKYTVDVKYSSTYIIGIMYTANGDGSISLSADDNKAEVKLFIPSTNQKEDTIAWRQWHHWNKLDSLGKIYLCKGIHVLKITTLTNGNMNYDFLELKLGK